MSAQTYCPCGAIQPLPEMSSDDPRGVVCQLCGVEIFAPLAIHPQRGMVPRESPPTWWQQLRAWWEDSA